MVLLLTHDDVAAALEGHDLMPEVIDVIEASFHDIAADRDPRTPTAFPFDLSRPKIYTVMGAAPGSNVVGGCVHLRGGEVGMAPHASYKLAFDLASGNLLCVMEDGPVHKYMHGAHVGIATRWLARPDAETVALVTSSATPPAKGGAADGGVAARTAEVRADFLTMSSLEAICAVKAVTKVYVFGGTAERSEKLAGVVAERFGAEGVPTESAEEAVRAADIVSLTTNTASRGLSGALRPEWLQPGQHVNTVIRGEVDAATAKRTKVFPASVPDLLATEPPWEPFASLVRDGELDVPAGLDEVIAGLKPGRTSPDDITLYTGASIGAQHAALAAWVYRHAVERGVGLRWDQDSKG